MSDRVCYLARAAQGEVISRVRLVGARTDESWPPVGQAEGRASEAADWIAERLRAGGGPEHEIGLLCVDVDGARCRWLTSSGTSDEAIIASMTLGHGGEAPSDRFGPSWSPPTADDAGVQALAVETGTETSARQPLWRRKKKATPQAGKRLAVVSMPDVQARLVLDALDERGVQPKRVISLWHAMARAWEGTPSGAGEAGASRVVASSALPMGVVLVDETGSRLVWCWCMQGCVLAAGSQRLAESGSKIDDAVLSRLAADWLAWSVQLGFGPSRLVCVMPEASDRASVGTGAMYRLLGKLWPNATAEMIAKDDPVGATLQELATLDQTQSDAAGTLDPRQHLLGLSQRPGRSHRALYRALALGLVAGAIFLAGLSWKLWGAASMARSRADGIDASIREMVKTAMAGKGGGDAGVFEFERELSRRRDASRAPKGLTPPKPILKELDTISMVIGSLAASRPTLQLTEISLSNITIRVRLTVPDTATGDELVEAMTRISGTSAEWRGEFDTPIGGGGDATKRPFRLDGLWRKEDGTSSGGS